MQLVQSPEHSDAQRRDAGSQETNADQAFIMSFNTELAQAQREALKALREVMAETADPAADDNTRLDDDDLQTRAARFRRLSLRLRAATAILRVKPMADSAAACDTEPPRNSSTTRRTSKTPNEVSEASPRTPAASESASDPGGSSSPTQHAAAPQSRRSDSARQRNGHAGSHAAQSPQSPPVTAP